MEPAAVTGYGARGFRATGALERKVLKGICS